MWAREAAGFRPTSAIPSVLDLPGDLDAGALEAAWRQLGARHHALRTVFAARPGDEPVQVPAGPEPAWDAVDLADAGPSADVELRRLTAETTDRPFDLAAGPPARARLIRLAPDRHALVSTVHHLATDAWSQLVLYRELRQLYRLHAGDGGTAPPEPPLQYADYAAWQRGAAAAGHFDAQLDHWARALAGAPAGLDLPLRPPAARAGPQAAPDLGLLDLRVPAAALGALRDLSRRAGASVFMTLLAAFAAALASEAGQDDVVVGTPAAARSRSELEGMVGFLANPLPIRVRVDGSAGLADLVASTRAAASEAFARQDVPIDLVVERTGARPPGPGRAPLFQALFVLQNVGERLARQAAAAAPQPTEDAEAPDGGEPALYPFLPFYSPSGATFDIGVQLIERGGGLAGNLEYDAARVDTATAEAVRERLANLLARAAADPAAPLATALAG